MASKIGSSFTTVYNGFSNVLRNNVGIAVSAELPEQLKWVALWDTGATNTVITKKVVDALQLKPVSVGRACTPNGAYNAYIYYIDLFLPNRVSFPNLRVMEGEPAGCDILIGMDVIGRGDFAVSNHGGQTVFTYRHPSCARMDFVEHSYMLPTAIRDTPDGPARNSKCPCGSGKKYKQCCGKNKQTLS